MRGTKYAAVACCLGSALSIALSALLPAQGRAAGGSVDFPVGIPVALAAAFFIACMGIAQELYQGSWAGPLFDLYLLEMTMASSIVASLCVCAYGAATSEFPAWAPQLAGAAAQSSGARALIIGVCVILPVLKLATRNSKYAVILASSALFFEFVQASEALVASVASVLAFSEPFGAGFIAAIVLLAAAFGLYAKAKVDAKQTKAAAGEAAKGSAAGQAAAAAEVVVHSPLAVEAWGERAQWHSQPLHKGGKAAAAAAWQDVAPEGSEDRRVVI